MLLLKTRHTGVDEDDCELKPNEINGGSLHVENRQGVVAMKYLGQHQTAENVTVE